MEEEGVSFQLVDFSSDHNNYWLNGMLRRTLATTRKIPFSLNFTERETIKLKSASDVKISHRYDCILACSDDDDGIYVYERKTKMLIKKIEIERVQSMIIDDVNDEIYLVSNSSPLEDQIYMRATKFRLSEMLNNKRVQVWSSTFNTFKCNGMVLYNDNSNRYLIGLMPLRIDNHIVILECNTGKQFETMDVAKSLAIGVNSRNEIIVTTKEAGGLIYVYSLESSQIPILKLKDSKKIKGLKTISSIVCCENSIGGSLMLCCDNTRTTIGAIDRRFKVVKAQKEKKFGEVKGIYVDETCGELYVCGLEGITIYK